jgi:hypothetical protein
VISAYPIGGKVWLVSTNHVAQAEVPETLPLGSPVLTVDEAIALYVQLSEAISASMPKVQA